MPKQRTTVTLDEEVLRWVRIRAARQGKGDSQVIEEALRRDLGMNVLDQAWSTADISESAAMELALEAQHLTRRRRK
jgi:hypothetical protein